MTELKTTAASDLLKINDWVAQDPWHLNEAGQSHEWLLTGNGLLTFCLADDEGPLCFVRLDDEGKMVRLRTRFGPESEVSKKRLVIGLLMAGIPAIAHFSRKRGYKGIVFETLNPSLVIFMGKQGFLKAAGENDYALTFGETQNVIQADRVVQRSR